MIIIWKIYRYNVKYSENLFKISKKHISKLSYNIQKTYKTTGFLYAGLP